MNLEILRTRIQELRESLADLETDIELALTGKTENTVSIGEDVISFEEIYEAYPRKRGKTLGLKRCKSQVKTRKALSDLHRAVLNYREAVAGKDPQYVMHFSTFMNCWKEWVNPEDEPVSPQAPKQREQSQHFLSQAERIQRGEL